MVHTRIRNKIGGHTFTDSYFKATRQKQWVSYRHFEVHRSKLPYFWNAIKPDFVWELDPAKVLKRVHIYGDAAGGGY